MVLWSQNNCIIIIERAKFLGAVLNEVGSDCIYIISVRAGYSGVNGKKEVKMRVFSRRWEEVMGIYCLVSIWIWVSKQLLSFNHHPLISVIIVNGTSPRCWRWQIVRSSTLSRTISLAPHSRMKMKLERAKVLGGGGEYECICVIRMRARCSIIILII